MKSFTSVTPHICYTYTDQSNRDSLLGGHHYPSISALRSALRATPFWWPPDFTERCLLLWLAVCLGTCPKEESACVSASHLLLATLWNSLIPPTLELPEEPSCTFGSLKEWDPGIEKGGTWKVAHVLLRTISSHAMRSILFPPRDV